MYRATITLRPDAPNFPLRPVWCGRNSDALFILEGVPEGFTARLYITRPGAQLAVYFDAVVSETSGEVYVFAAGANFPSVGHDGKYEVLLTETATGHKFWCGTGTLNVLMASSGAVTEGYGTGMQTYVWNPVTRKYYLVTATVNEDGTVTSETSQEGVDLT